MATMIDAYLRISRLNGRVDGDNVSESDQRARVMAWVAGQGGKYEIANWYVEVDVSGRNMRRPKFDQVMARIKDGTTRGVVTAYRSRFGRNMLGCLQAIQELEEAGGAALAADGFDARTPEGRMAIGVMMVFAEYELEAIEQRWAYAVDGAISRGVYMATVAPVGYTFGEGKGLEPDPEVAPVIVKLFERRAAGEDWGSLHRWITEEAGVKVRAKPGGPLRPISRAAVRFVVLNRAYVGEQKLPSRKVDGVKVPGGVKRGAHEPLVTEALWDRANAVRGAYSPRDGSVSAATPLAGLARCASCGKRLRGTSHGKPGAKRYSYSCTNPACTGRASMKAPWLDEHVEDVVRAAIAANEPHVVAVLQGDERYTEAQAAVAEARADLESYRDDPAILRAIGVEQFTAGLASRMKAVELAREALRNTPAPEAKPLSFQEGLGIEGTRRYLASHVTEVRVRPAGHGTVAERVDVVFVGADEPWSPPAVLAAA